MVLSTGKEDLVRLQEEIDFRNPVISGCIESIRPVSKMLQHVKIYLSTMDAQMRILDKRRIYIKDG